jgi:hypothetical protein
VNRPENLERFISNYHQLFLSLSQVTVTAQEHLFVSPLWKRPIQNAGGLAELTGGAEVVAKTYPPLLPSPFPG